jgi:biotin transport system ATP-binding protein
VLIMDEPTTLLDLRNAEAVGRIVASLRQQVILLTHHLSLLTDFDRVLVFDEGRIVGDAEPAAAIAEYQERMR